MKKIVKEVVSWQCPDCYRKVQQPVTFVFNSKDECISHNVKYIYGR